VRGQKSLVIPQRKCGLVNVQKRVSRGSAPGLRWMALGVPRGGASWVGDLPPQLIRDAFRAAGYSPEQVEGFSEIVEKRIVELRGCKGDL